MLTYQTLERLRELKLKGMADALHNQREQPDVQALTFEERLGLLVDQEWTYRQNRRLQRLLKDAKLRLPACLEDIDYRQPRGLDRAVLRSLGTCQWLRASQNVLLEGPTGIGKTYIACALGNAACRQGFRVRYERVPRLLSDLNVARGDGSYPKFLARLARTHLLILDDFGLAPLSAADARDLLEIIEDRCDTRSTLVAAQLPVADWHRTITDPTVADAIVDRLVHNAHKIHMKGESMRKVISQQPLTDQ